MNTDSMVNGAINSVFEGFFNKMITGFATTLANVMGASSIILDYPIVQSGIHYSQLLAFTLLVLKVMNEAFQTYILYQNGDPDADPTNLLIRTAQAVAVIATLPEIVIFIFNFGNKVVLDVANLSTGQTDITTWAAMAAGAIATAGLPIIILCIVVLMLFLVIAIQSLIRGGELALMAVLGPIMALNLTANNRNIWSAWFKQLVIICTSQGIQLFMVKGALGLVTTGVLADTGLLTVFAWLWVTVKVPKYLQQFAYSSGFSGAVGGTAKQAGSMAIMRKMMTKGV